MKLRNSSLALSAARRSCGRSRRARGRASACGAIGMLMPHAQDKPIGPPRIAALLQELELLGWTALLERGD